MYYNSFYQHDINRCIYKTYMTYFHGDNNGISNIIHFMRTIINGKNNNM